MGLSVVKIGGSLALQPPKLRALCKKISELSKKNGLVVVPGGGEFADTVRLLDKRFGLSGTASHRMAILGMDQYGLLLADLTPSAVAVDELEEAKNTLAQGKLAVFLPSNLIFHEDFLENSWDVTSDSIALYLAAKLEADKVLLVTDVDGVYTDDPKQHADAKLIKKLTADQLLAMHKRTSVDTALPKLLRKWPIDCYVVNGASPARIESVLKGQDAVYTLISKRKSTD